MSKEDRSREIFFRIALGLFVLVLLLLVVQPFITKMLQNFERTAMQQVVVQLNVAANFKMAEYVALDKLQQLPEQLSENPMSWLDLDDLGGYDRYLGEVDKLNFEQLDSKQWVYDRSVNRLIYKVKYPELLRNEDPFANRIQFRLLLALPAALNRFLPWLTLVP